jgi:cell division ATPase FtsA
VAPAGLALVQAAKTLKALGPEPAALVDIGQRRTTIGLVENGEMVYARDVTLGADHLTEALLGQVSVGAQTVQLSPAEAQALLEEVGIPEAQPGAMVGQRGIPAATYLAMLQPCLEQLASELRRTMTYGAQTSSTAPARIVISGDGSRLPHVDAWLAKYLGLPVTRLSCERLVGAEGAAAGVVCGLALLAGAPKLDLQPDAMRRRGMIVRATNWLWQGLAVVAVLLWLGAFWWQTQLQKISERLSPLEARWTSLQPVVELQEAVETQTRVHRRFQHDQSIPLEWFERLAHGFPAPVRLTQLSVDAKRQVQMSGEAQQREQSAEAYVSELSLWLEEGEMCHDMQLGAGRRTTPTEHLVEFTLTCRR